MASVRSLFRRGSLEWWFNGLFAILVLLYALYAVASLRMGGLFGHLGVDFRSFRCSAEIAVSQGFSQIYDQDLQDRCQRALYEEYARGPQPANYALTPTFYLPVFMLPLLPLLLLPPVPSFALWTILNGALLVWYLRRLGRALPTPPRQGVWIKMALSFPAFMTLFLGQVNVWLLVFAGEFLLASLRGKEFRSGLWLAGLALKPQLLVLFLPGLLLGRRFKVVAGAAAAGAALLVLSLALVGLAGTVDFGRLLLDSPSGVASAAPEVMMNWRALAIHLGELLPPPLAWGVAGAGMAFTVGVALWLWLRPPAAAAPQFGLLLLGTCAATFAVAWHSHVHMALLLAAPLLFLDARGMLPRAVLNLWLVFPGLASYVVGLLLPQGAAPLLAVGMLLLNLYLLIWTARRLRRAARAENGRQQAGTGQAP